MAWKGPRIRWSKTRRRFLDDLADSLRGRFDIHATAYTKSSIDIGRDWVTFDGRELYSVAQPYIELKVGGCKITSPVHRYGAVEDGKEMPLGAAARLLCNDLSIEDGMAHEDQHVRGLAYLSRRTGKRRLERAVDAEESLFGELMLALRRFADGTDPYHPPRCPRCGEALAPIDWGSPG